MGVITDPIADLLTRIRNANTANHQTVDIPASKMKKAVAQILADEGFISNIEELKDGPKARSGSSSSTVRKKRKSSPVCGASRVPGCDAYPTKTEIPRVLGGLGLVIIDFQGHHVGQTRQARRLRR